MTIQTFVVGDLSTNCYLISDEHDNAVVIDPGDDAARILDAITAGHLTLRAVLLTHLHFDHYLAAPALAAATGATLIIPREEESALNNDSRTYMSMLPPERRVTLSPDRFAEEGDTVTAGDLTFTFWHTPGHSAGSGCWFCGDALFSGDTLFAGTIGRCDPPPFGSEQAMRRSLDRLSAIRENLRVFSGHGEPTTLDIERRFNPYLK